MINGIWGILGLIFIAMVVVYGIWWWIKAEKECGDGVDIPGGWL